MTMDTNPANPQEQEPEATPAEANPPETVPKIVETAEVVDAVPEIPQKTPEVALAPEATPTPETTPTAEGPPDPEREMAIRKIKERWGDRRELLSTGRDVGAFIPKLMQVFENDKERVNRWIVDVLRSKGVDEAKAAERANEMMLLEESELTKSIEPQIEKVFAARSAEERKRFSSELLGAFHGLIAGGHLNASDVEKLFAGGIRIQDKAEGKGNYYGSVASISRNEQHQPVLNLYGAFFKRRGETNEPHNDQAHLLRHEAGHVISGRIFGERLTGELIERILTAVNDGNADISSIPPEFHSVVMLLRDPAKAAGLEKRPDGHLANRFKALAKEQDPEKLKDFRRVMIYEILAERTANYLASEGNIESYTAFRLNENDKGSGAVYEPLSEQALYNAISAGIKGKEHLRADTGEADWDFDDMDYELYEPDEMYLPPSSAPEPSGGGTSQGQSPWDKFIDFLIGTDQYRGKSTPAPAGYMKKAA